MGHSYIHCGDKVVRTKQQDVLCALIAREAGSLAEGSEIRLGVEPLVRGINEHAFYRAHDTVINLNEFLPTRQGLSVMARLLEQIIGKIDAFGPEFPDDYMAGLPSGQTLKRRFPNQIVPTAYVKEAAVELKKILSEVLGEVQ